MHNVKTGNHSVKEYKFNRTLTRVQVRKHTGEHIAYVSRVTPGVAKDFLKTYTALTLDAGEGVFYVDRDSHDA